MGRGMGSANMRAANSRGPVFRARGAGHSMFRANPRRGGVIGPGSGRP
jgi:hypothetical protein